MLFFRRSIKFFVFILKTLVFVMRIVYHNISKNAIARALFFKIFKKEL